MNPDLNFFSLLIFFLSSLKLYIKQIRKNNGETYLVPSIKYLSELN